MKPSAFRALAPLLTVLAASLLTGCRSSPCADSKKTAPATLNDIAASLDNSSFCFADGTGGGQFSIWADDARSRKAQLDLRVKMRALGWGETGGRNYDGSFWEGFAKGDEVLRVKFDRPTKMASFGSKIDRDGVYVGVSYSKKDQKSSTAR